MKESVRTEAPARGATVPSSMVVRDPRSVLRFNNVLQILTNGAWYVAAPFVPLYLTAQGASVVLVGIIVGASGIAPLLISVYAGALVDARGPALVAKGSVVLFATAGAILTSLHSIWAVAVAYTLMGIGNIGFAVAPQAIVAAASTPQTRIRNYGTYALWNSAGAVVGPMIGGAVAGRLGYAPAFALVWMLMVPSFAVAAALRGAPAGPRAPGSPVAAHTLVGTIARQRGTGAVLFIAFMMVCAQTLQQSFYPLYLQEVGLSATLIGFAIAAVSLSSMLVRAMLARGVTSLGYGGVLPAATALAAVAFAITPWLHRFWPLVLASALMGASFGFTQPLGMSLLSESVAPEFWGVAFGIRQCVQRLGAVLSPVAFGLVSRADGIRSALWLGALILAAAVPVVARATSYLRRTRGRIDDDAAAAGGPR
jgi:MFS family permease